MAILEIPVRSDLSAYSFQITLETVVYTFAFRFNARQDRWIWDVQDVDGVPIVIGVPLLYGLPLLDRFKSESLPPGRFIVTDETGAERNPGRDSLGEDFKLFYEESTTA